MLQKLTVYSYILFHNYSFKEFQGRFIFLGFSDQFLCEGCYLEFIFILFYSYLEGELIKFTDGGIAQILENRFKTQKDLDGLQQWVLSNKMWFSG